MATAGLETGMVVALAALADQAEGIQSLQLCLEPLCEHFIISPKQKVVVHAIFAGETTNPSFTIGTTDGELTIYASGEITGFIDCYVTIEGVRIAPECSAASRATLIS